MKRFWLLGLLLFILMSNSAQAAPRPALELVWNTPMTMPRILAAKDNRLVMAGYWQFELWNLSPRLLLKQVNLADYGSITEPCELSLYQQQIVTYCQTDSGPKLWDLQSGQFLKQLTAQSVTQPQKNTDAYRSYITYQDSLKIWDRQTGKLVKQIPYGGPIQWQTTANQLVIAMPGEGIHVWDLATGHKRFVIPMTHDIKKTDLVALEGKIAIRMPGEQVHVWDALSGKKLGWVQGHVATRHMDNESYNRMNHMSGGNPAEVHDVSFSNVETFTLFENQLLTTSRHLPYIKAWNLNSRQNQRTIPKQDVGYLLLTAGKKRHLWHIPGHFHSVEEVDFLSGKHIRTIEKTCDNLEQMELAPQYFVVRSNDTNLRLYNLRGEFQTALTHSNHVLAEIATQGEFTLTRSEHVDLWNTQTQRHLLQLKPYNHSIDSIRLSEDYIITNGKDQAVDIWDLSQETRVSRITGFGSVVSAMDLHGDKLMLGFDDTSKRTLALYDIHSGKQIQTYNGPSVRISSLAFENTNNVLVGSNHGVQRMDLKTGSLQTLIQNTQPYIVAEKIKPLGEHLLVKLPNVGLWNLKTMNNDYSALPPFDVSSFVPFGNQLLTSSSDTGIVFRDLKTGQILSPLVGGSHFETKSFLHQNKLIYYQTKPTHLSTMGFESVLKVLDLKTGQTQTLWASKTQNIEMVELQGNRLILALNKGLYLFDINTNRLVKHIPDYQHIQDAQRITPHKLVTIQPSQSSGSQLTLLKAWDLESGQLVWQREMKSTIQYLEVNAKYDPQQTYLIFQTYDEENDADIHHFLDIESGKSLDVPEAERIHITGAVGMMSISKPLLPPHGPSKVVWPTNDKWSLEIHDVYTNKLLTTLYPGKYQQFITRAGKLFVLLVDHFIKVYDLNTFQHLATLPHEGHVKERMDVLGDRYLIVDGYRNHFDAQKKVSHNTYLSELWDIQRYKKLWEVNNRWMLGVTLAGDKLIQNNGLNVTLFELFTGKELSSYTVHKAPDGMFITTPEGYYAGIGNYPKYAHYRYGNEIIEFKQLAPTFERPDLVWQAMQGIPLTGHPTLEQVLGQK